MQRLKVFYIADSYDGPHGGTEKQLLMLMRGMRGLGHEIQLFVFRHTDFTRSPPDGFPCHIEALDIHSIRSIDTIRKMRAFRDRIDTERPDAIHVFFNDASIVAPLFCKRPDNVLITSRRDMGYWHSFTSLSLLRLANRRVDRIICNSRAVAREVERKERVREDKLQVVYNGLEISRSRDSQTTGRADTVRESGRNDRLRLCLVANMRPIKRQEDFIQAAAIVSREFPESEFLIVGEPHEESYLNRLRSLVDDLNLRDHVRFLGLVRDTSSLMSQCHIGVLTSQSEGLSNAIMEYMAWGLPVVCTNAGGNVELVEHGCNGYLYAPGDVSSLADYLKRLCRDETLRLKMGTMSLERINRFTPEYMVQAHVAIYQGHESERTVLEAR